jgi:hypothetical protein
MERRRKLEEIMNGLADGNKDAEECIKVMASGDIEKLKIATEITLPFMRDKMITGEVMGAFWEICERDFVLFTAFVGVIPKDIVDLLGICCKVGMGISPSIKQDLHKHIDRIKSMKDEFEGKSGRKIG